jgi:AcrR family transcriptional regulator
MSAKKSKPELDLNTEEKIKQAARTVFHRKGFAATRTRDIAEEAGINLALLNYYFRSKEKLFDLIMLETMQGFLKNIATIFVDEQSNLEQKIEQIVSAYIDMLVVEPHIPLFIMSELRSNPNQLLTNMNIKHLILNSSLSKQYKQAIEEGRIVPLPLLHFIMNLLGLTVFPFIASPMLKLIGDIPDENYTTLMLERKKMIPQWISKMMQPDTYIN